MAAVQLKSRVPGQIFRIHFEQGADVREGQLLFTIDPREYEQAVRQSEAAAATERAAVGQAEANYQRDLANAQNARAQANRYATLAAKGIISRESNEKYQTDALAAEKAGVATMASIESARAALQGAEAKLADAKLQLSYTAIRAPITGRTGSLAYKIGDVITANADPPLIVINQIAPVYVSFSVPEQTLGDLRRYSANGSLPVFATPQQGSTQAIEGRLSFLDNRVDPSSGTILLRGKFANKDRRLWPGQFVNVAVRLAVPDETVVPFPAVRNSQNGNYVFVAKPDMTVEQRTVEMPRSFENLAVITKGIQPGEKVVVEGQLRLRPGTKIRAAEPQAESTRARTQ